MKHLIYPGLFFLIVILFSGCVKRELELPESQTVRIDFDWSDLSDQQNIPSCIQLRFYSTEGNFLFAHNSGPDHFHAYLPEGKYKILIYTPDTTDIHYEHMDNFKDAQITVSPQQKESPETPSNIYGTAIRDLTVLTGQPVDTVVTVRPYLHIVTIQLKITGSTSEVTESSAIIDGTAEAVNMSTGFPVLGTNSSVSANLYPEGGYYLGSFRLTGNDDRYPSVIYFKLRFSDGTERVIQHNFADFMEKIDHDQSDAPLSIELTIDIQLIDGVFTTTLKDWIYKQGEVILD